MSIPKKIILYSVPNIEKVSGGPRTRITKISQALHKVTDGYSIIGGSFSKLKKTLKAPKADICYVESATNRLKLIDLFCLLILKRKTECVVVYIRDVYTFTLSENYKTLRKVITKLFVNLTNKFFISYTTFFAFPTNEMGNIFMKHYKVNLPFISLPPGSFALPEGNKNKFTAGNIKNRKKSFLYLGSTGYKFSGIKLYLEFAAKYKETYDFHILSSNDLNNELKEKELKNTVKVFSVSHDEVFQYIGENSIDFLIHPRPINSYDSITYPIKIMDCISIGLPIISFKHQPLISLLGKDYPFFIDTIEDIKNILADRKLDAWYNKSLGILTKVKEETSYEKQIEKIIGLKK